eukprot:76083-Amphidinium_carterae.1
MQRAVHFIPRGASESHRVTANPTPNITHSRSALIMTQCHQCESAYSRSALIMTQCHQRESAYSRSALITTQCHQRESALLKLSLRCH